MIAKFFSTRNPQWPRSQTQRRLGSSARRALVLTAIALCFVSAGCDESSESGAASSGVVTDTWASYCVATFMKDHVVRDVFDDVLFTARADEQYLISGMLFGSGSDRVSMYYLSNAGPIDFEVEVEEGQTLPLTTSCPILGVKTLTGVFRDVTLFEDEALTTEACQLTEGTAVESSSSGYALVSEISFDSKPATYRVTLGGLSSQCGGLEEAFISVPSAQALGSQQHIVPIQRILAPN